MSLQKMATLSLSGFVYALLVIELVLARTVTHHQTITNANGDKVIKSWTTTDDSDDVGSLPQPAITLSNTQQQTETQRISGSNPDVLKKAALEKGMDPVAIEELLSNKQPVVQTTTDDKGQKRTTTYELEPDGSILRKTVIEGAPSLLTPSRSSFVMNNAPWPTAPKTDANKIDTDWEWNPHNNPFGTPNTARRTYTHTWQTPTTTVFHSPNGQGPVNWPNFDDFFNNRRGNPETETPKTTTTAKPIGNFPDNWNSSPWFNRKPADPFDAPVFWSNRPNFSWPPTISSTTPTSTSTSTTRKTITTTISPPPPTSAISPKANNNSNKPLTTTPLPSLEDFLKAQYGPTTKRNIVERDYDPTTKSTSTSTSTTTSTTTTVSTPGDKTVTTINLDDLPITEILKHGQPVDEDFLKSVPKELRPILQATPSTKTIKIDNIPMSQPGDSNPTLESTLRSYTKTVHSPTLPTAADLDPNMQEVLRRAGINPDDIKSINGDTITKTRVEPDGHTITTTYRVSSSPSFGAGDGDGSTLDVVPNILSSPTTPTVNSPYNPFHRRPLESGGFGQPPSSFPSNGYPTFGYPSYNYPSPNYPNFNFPPYNAPVSPIALFLGRVGLSIPDIEAKNGELVQTIVDQDGRVLTAKFLLSSVKGTNDGKQNKQQTSQNPIK